MMVLGWCGLYFKDAVLVHVLKVMWRNPERLWAAFVNALVVLMSTLLIRAAHRSPPAHRDAGSAPKAQRDWRNMKYLTQPVLAVTYWERAGCLSIPEIDLMLRGSRADGSEKPCDRVVFPVCLCWVNYPASLRRTRLRWAAVCSGVCVFAQWLQPAFSKHLWDQSAVFSSREAVVTLLSSDSSSGLWESVNCGLLACAERSKVTAWTSLAAFKGIVHAILSLITHPRVVPNL